MGAFDFEYFPNIFDLILNFAPPEAIAALRLTDRYVQERIDRRLVQRVVLAADPVRFYTKVGHLVVTVVSPNTKELAAHDKSPFVRCVDVFGRDLPDACRTLFPLFKRNFRNLKCVTLYCLSGTLPSDSGEVHNVICPIHCLLASKLDPQVHTATRTITVLPKDLSRCPNTTLRWQDSAVDTTIVFAPGYDPFVPTERLKLMTPEPSAVPSTPIIQSRERYSYSAFFHDFIPALQRARDNGPETFTVVGLGTWAETVPGGSSKTTWVSEWKDAVGEDLITVPLLNGKLRFLTIDEWRHEATEEEWDLVESAPGCDLSHGGPSSNRPSPPRLYAQAPALHDT